MISMTSTSVNYDIIIIGAGAAGLMCAAEAGKHGLKVAVIDHSKNIGQKILISGGGRCNFSNRNISAANYISEQPDFCRSAISRFTVNDITGLLDVHKVKYVEKNNGQLFCAYSSRSMLTVLEEECKKGNVQIFRKRQVEKVEKGDRFRIVASGGEFSSRALVVATGGLSYKSLGADDLGYRLAGQFGHKVTELRRGLVPFLFNAEDKAKYSHLSGVSFTAKVSSCGASFTDPILFTYKGLSGPAILQISSYWKQREPVTIDMAGAEKLTKRVEKLFQGVRTWRFVPAAVEGYDNAEVTVGGVDVSDISSKTFESKKVKRLYFIGEVLDVTGQLGGYNLHWAFASGSCAGRGI